MSEKGPAPARVTVIAPIGKPSRSIGMDITLRKSATRTISVRTSMESVDGPKVATIFVRRRISSGPVSGTNVVLTRVGFRKVLI